MRVIIREKVKKIFFSKWFWIGFLLLFLLTFVTELTIGVFLTYKGITSGDWHPVVLSLGVFYIILNLIGQRQKSRQLQRLGRWTVLVFIIAALFLYGFPKNLYFIATVFFLTKIFRWIIRIGTFVSKKRQS